MSNKNTKNTAPEKEKDLDEIVEEVKETKKDKPVKDDAETKEEAPKKEKQRNLADGRKLRYGSLAAALTAVVVVAVILLNIFANVLDSKYPLTIDVTGTKVLTMSDEFKTFASSINQDVHITVCTAEDVMKNPGTSLKEVDLIFAQFYTDLKQLQSLSKNKVTYEFVDLNQDVKKAAALEQYNVQPGSILFKSGEQTQIAAVDDLFTGDENFQSMMMQLQYYGDSEITEYTLTSNVEQMLCTDIQIVQNANLHPITILTGHGESSLLIEQLTTVLNKNGYEVNQLKITSMDNTFDPSSTMAIIPAPSNDYSADELMLLRRWVENGGQYNHHLVYIVNYNYWLPSLSDFFTDDYGIEVTPYWAEDESADRQFQVSTLGGLTMNPLYIFGDTAETKYTEAAEGNVKMPCCVALNLLWSDDDQMGQYAKPLVTFPETCKLRSYLELIAAANGDTSVEKSEPQPAEKYPMVGMGFSRKTKMVDGKNVSSGALVCGSVDMLLNYLDDTTCDNKKVFLAAINGVNGTEKGTFIAGKEIVSPYVDFGTTNAKKLIGVGIFTIGIPTALLVICLVVFLRRKNL